ncbi:MAG: EF-hand domain-containing protein [Gemmataceae bacterium]|nr:EF-hand domain-containing protein [Gemmataceae bacterium]
MNRLLLACGVLAASVGSLAAQPERLRDGPPAPKGSEPIELVFLRDQGPVVLRLHVLAGGQPVHVGWQQYLERWFDYLDRHNRGALGDKDLQGAPNAGSMRILAAQGGFFPFRGGSLTLRDFGKTSEQTITKDEFIGYYQKNGVAPIQMTAAPTETTARVNDALFKKLDTNGDGKLSQAEVQAAKSLAADLDVNDDELVSAQELAPGTAPTGGRTVVSQRGQMLAAPAQGTSYFHLSGDTARVQLAFLLLARYDVDANKHVSRKEIGLDQASFQRLDANSDGTLDLAELARVPKHAPSVELIAHLRAGNQSGNRAGNQPPVAAVSTGSLPAQAVRVAGDQAAVALGDADIVVQNQDAFPGRPVANQFAFIAQQLRAADTKKRGYVELKDLDSPQLQFVRQLFPILDRDEDGKLTDKETQAYLALQGQAREAFVSFSVQEQGRNWLQLFDANRDGQLGPRELMTAWRRLQAHDRNSDAAIDAQELPLQFRVVLNPAVNQQFVVAGRGMFGPRPASAAYPPQAPLWFKKMDRNADGDVSRHEFLGARADFDRIDQNGDGLIDAGEAAAATRQE